MKKMEAKMTAKEVRGMEGKKKCKRDAVLIRHQRKGQPIKEKWEEGENRGRCLQIRSKILIGYHLNKEKLWKKERVSRI